MDATRTSRIRRMIAVAAVVAIPSACAVLSSPSSSAQTGPTMPPAHHTLRSNTPNAAQALHVSATTAATAPIVTATPATSTTTEPFTVTTQPSTSKAPVQGCWADLAAQVGWPAEAISHLTAIIERESHCDPSSNTGYRPSTGDWSLGLLQINTLGDLLISRQQACGIGAREELLDPATNLRCGLALYNAAGFGPWGG